MDLIDAVQNGDIDRVRELLDSGINPNIIKYGQTPLKLASRYGSSDVVRLLLEHDANPNIRDNNGDTPLASASWQGYTHIVKLLLNNNNASINIQNDYGYTPLLLASYRGYTEIVRMLLESGADINIKNNFGDTAYDIALNEGYTEIARLIKHHMDLQRMQRPLQNLAFMKYFLDRDDLDIDTASKIFSNVYSYNPSVHTRMIDEHKKDPLTKSKQRLATMKGIRDRNSVLQYLREPELMENVNKYLSSMRPQPSVHSRMMLEDKQMGRGKRSSGKHGKKKSKTKKKRNYRFY